MIINVIFFNHRFLSSERVIILPAIFLVTSLLYIHTRVSHVHIIISTLPIYTNYSKEMYYFHLNHAEQLFNIHTFSVSFSYESSKV